MALPEIERRAQEFEFARRTIKAAKLNSRLAGQLDAMQGVLLVVIARLTAILAIAEKALLEQYEFLLKVSEPAIRFDPEPRTGPPPLEYRPSIQPNAPALI
jgi:hypothetical protein